MAVVFPLPGGGSFILGGGLDSLFQDIQDLFRFILPVISKEEGERGRVFLGILEQLDEISAGNISIDEFLVNIEDFFPASPSTTGRISDLAEEAQYNGFLSRFEEILNSEDPSSAAQDLFRKYETAGIADNTFIQNSFSFTNPQQIMDRAVLGDGDIGVTVDVCTSPGQTNCVDPKAINDLWEDFGRHVRVIFKGLQIPGLPEWLPLPGIMRLPTIGEIWDRIIGPFNEAASNQLKDCMLQDDDGDGVSNTASYCMENRDIINIIKRGLEDASEDIVDATTKAVGGIVDKALETLDCVTDPAACARTIKDTIEGVLGGADPTQPGLPDWMRVIIIGSQYGDEILKELEKIFDSDIDGDGTIGIISGQVTCWDGSVADKEEDCPPDTRVDCWDGSKAESLEQCPVDTREGATVEECSKLGRVHVPDQSNQTKGSCGACSDNVNTVPEDENNPMSPCVSPDDPNQNEGDDCVTGAPLNAEGTVGPAPDFDCIPNEGVDCTVPDTGEQGTIENGVCNPPINGTPTGPDGIKCEDGFPGQQGFGLEEQQNWWLDNCQETHCTDGSLIPENGQCPDDSEPPDNQTCDNNAVNYPDCNQCENGESPDQHIDGDCNKDLKDINGTENCAQQGKVTNEDGSCGGCDTEKGYVLSELTGRCYIPQTGDCAPDADGNPQVRDGWGRCVPIGSECRAESFGGQDCRDPETNAYQFGVIDADGSCVCPGDIKQPPEVDCSEITEDNYLDCKKVKCPKGSTTPYADSLDDCVQSPEPCSDENRQKNNDGSCGENCNAGFDQPAGYDVCTSIEQLCADGAEGYGPDNELCGTDNGCPEGQKKFDGENCDSPCPTNPDIGANSLDCVAPECDNDATNYPDCNQCPKGKILNDQGVCVTTDVASCDEQNRVTNEDGTCGECKAGYTFDTNQDLCVADGGEDECANGATDFPACTTCPEGQSMDEEGNCVGVTPPPETGGGGGGGGMMGSFTPFLAGISYTPQAVPEPPAPAQKDYVVELDNLIKRSLFEGMA